MLTYVTAEQIDKFSTPAAGEFSNVGRNYFRLAGYRNLSMSIAKRFRITEGQQLEMRLEVHLEMRLEVHNVPNSVHYDEPASNRYGNSDFGKVDPLTVFDDGRGLTSDPRKMQVSAQYTF